MIDSSKLPVIEKGTQCVQRYIANPIRLKLAKRGFHGTQRLGTDMGHSRDHDVRFHYGYLCVQRGTRVAQHIWFARHDERTRVEARLSGTRAVSETNGRTFVVQVCAPSCSSRRIGAQFWFKLVPPWLVAWRQLIRAGFNPRQLFNAEFIA